MESQTGLSSYPKVWNVGHPHILDLFQDEVVVQEKVDGSQFSFGLIDGEPRCRSRGREVYIEAPDKMFQKAVDTVVRLAPDLTPEWIYRAEYLSKPRHNALTYDRAPKDNLVIFDINTGPETYLPYEDVVKEATRLGLEVVPHFFTGKVHNLEALFELLKHESFLGGPSVEGIVVKNYTRFGKDAKALMGKYVSESFKEIHQSSWKASNPGRGDVIRNLTVQLRTEARWEKAVQHLTEAGAICHEPKDIGALVKLVQDDIDEECEALVKQALYDWAWPQIRRGVSGGIAEWYKKRLAERQQF